VKGGTLENLFFKCFSLLVNQSVKGGTLENLFFKCFSLF
jgi:hypothetical protein